MRQLNIHVNDDLFKRVKIHSIHENVSTRIFLTRIIREALVKKENVNPELYGDKK